MKVGDKKLCFCLYRFHGEGYQEGYAEGSHVGVVEGRRYGSLHGAKMGSEVNGKILQNRNVFVIRKFL